MIINNTNEKRQPPHGRLPHTKHKLKSRPGPLSSSTVVTPPFIPSEAPPWDSRPVSGAGVVHYHSLHWPRSVPTALGPAPLVTINNTGSGREWESFFREWNGTGFSPSFFVGLGREEINFCGTGEVENSLPVSPSRPTTHFPLTQHAMHCTLTQFNWTTRTHCTNTSAITGHHTKHTHDIAYA